MHKQINHPDYLYGNCRTLLNSLVKLCWLAGLFILPWSLHAQETPVLLQVHVPVAGPDSDGDGIRNQDDLDDDNDGILDVNEGLVDADNNGVADATSTDTDGDGTPDGLDLDSDNDGILDNLETRSNREDAKALDQVPNGAIDIGIAVGANGVADVTETYPDSGVLVYNLLDSDGDGIADFRDTDSDNDGIYDVVEAGASDNDADGRLDGFSDADGKGVADAIQSSGLPIFDTDGDGVLDYRDTDSDGDGIPDAVEAGDAPHAPIDSDGDGAADYRELDSDGDGTSDAIEAGAIPSEPADADGNGIADYREGGNGDSNGIQTAIQTATPTGTAIRVATSISPTARTPMVMTLQTSTISTMTMTAYPTLPKA